MLIRLRLRQRLMIAVTLLLAAFLAAAAMLVVINAHRAIADEMVSSVALATDLIEASLTSGADDVIAARQLAGIGHLRHLCLTLVRADSEPAPCPAKPPPQAPAWFAVITRPKELPEQRIQVAEKQAIRILADPEDEIGEAWRDTRGLLGLLLLFYTVSVVMVYYLLGRATVPVARIDRALQDIEHGDYDIRLPTFSLPEFDGIAAHFNHMAATLAAARGENRRLRNHSLRIQEDERRNLSRELHDELGQSVTAIRADAASILARGDTLPDGVAESAQAIAEVAGHIYDQARLMMRRLRPPGLDELGLDAALEEHIAGWQRNRVDIAFVYKSDGVPDDVSPTVAIHVFRLVQEALTNALRHARARRIQVQLNGTATLLHVVVTDDGRGFDVTGGRPGLGLAGMQERIDLLGGHLRLSSTADRGSRVAAEIPIDGRHVKTGKIPIAND